MTYTKVGDWRPSPGIFIEGKALEIVKSDKSMSVLAGPGAGKTELLAQRAAFLLSTGLCVPPQRILAIAFKVDAARNLGARVTERCDVLHSQRFDSLTLDAFAKRIVDQFLEAIPNSIRPTPDYRIVLPSRDIWEEFRRKSKDRCPEVWQNTDKQLDKIVHQGVPHFEFEDAANVTQQIQWLWWHEQLTATPSILTFDMIKLLAILILRSHAQIVSALRRTYSYVFLDEFQDVTSRQYELIQTAFGGSKAVLTAVGDSNQAIMRWAGARADIFDQFEADFNASDERLLFNFRSNRRVVELINSLAAKFDNDYVPTECARENDPVPENAIEGWVFETRQAESECLAEFIAAELSNDETLTPSDFVILARLRVNDVEDRLKEAFSRRGLKIRNEARAICDVAIQDLVKEKAYSFLLSALKLATGLREGTPYQDCRNTIADVRGADLNSEKGHGQTVHSVRKLLDDMKRMINGRNPMDVEGREISQLVLSHVEVGELKRTYKEYAGGERLSSIISAFEAFFDECSNGVTSWPECIATIEGSGSVRLMTIHKSKGLEYHTVIFTECNDDAFWGNDDDVNVFFVALSRARERVYFSFARDSKGFSNVRPFIEQLQSSNVSISDKKL